MNTQNGKEGDPDKNYNRLVNLLGILIFVGSIPFSVAALSAEAQNLLLIALGVCAVFTGLLGLLIIASLKYHQHFVRCGLSVDALQHTVETITNLKQNEVADKINSAFQELNKVVELSKNLHQEADKQLQLLNQITPDNQKLVNALAELKSVIPNAKATVHELKVLTGLFLQNAPEQASQLRGLIYTLDELTTIENGIPNDSVVVIRRPHNIRAQNNEGLTRIMKTNTERGIKYSVIGEDMPSQWVQIPVELTSVDENDSSLVLPSLGLVLYIIREAAPWAQKSSYTCHEHESKKLDKLKMGKVIIVGFVLLPIPHGDGGLEHGYLALKMDGADIDELVNRIYK